MTLPLKEKIWPNRKTLSDRSHIKVNIHYDWSVPVLYWLLNILSTLLPLEEHLFRLKLKKKNQSHTFSSYFYSFHVLKNYKCSAIYKEIRKQWLWTSQTSWTSPYLQCRGEGLAGVPLWKLVV